MAGVLEYKTDPCSARVHFMAALEALNRPRHSYTSPFRQAEIRALALVGLGRAEEASATFPDAASARCGIDVFQRKDYELFATAGLSTGLNALLGTWRDIIATDKRAAGPWGGPAAAIGAR
jgi:hypothetical protein